MNETQRACLAGVILMFLSTATLAALPESDCAAEVSATLDEQESSQLQFSVEVGSAERCAEVEYDLVIEEQLSNGHVNRVRKTREVKVTGEDLSEIVEYTLDKGCSLLSYKASVVRCRTCKTTP